MMQVPKLRFRDAIQQPLNFTKKESKWYSLKGVNAEWDSTSFNEWN